MINETKNIVVTGASSGIGYHVALEFVKNGDTVYALARRKDKLVELQQEADHFPGKLIPIPFDLAIFDANILNSIFKNTESIDILINNAGLLLNKNFLDITEKEIQQVLNVNYISVIKTIQYFHSFLKKAKEPHIVNISSVGGVTGSEKFPGLSIYSSSKGALSILSECLSQDFEEDNIKVNCLALGSVDTDMLQQAFPDFKSQTSPAQISKYITNFALEGMKVMNGVTQVISVSNP
jgi:3-oxoacyl-[acyl-carrier protein] reductase